MTTTELIELLKKNERGGATGRPREVMFEVDGEIIDTDGIEVTGSGDGLISELYLSLPCAHSTQVNTPNTLETLDCVSRQAAIDGADKIIERDTSGNNDVVKAMQAWKVWIMALPTAQSEVAKDINAPSTDCISRRATLNSIDKIRQAMQMMDDTQRADIVMSGVRLCETAVRNQPTAQPQRMRGRWMESETDGFVCSVCRNGYKNQPTCMGKPMFEFCPVCGARMDGGEA